MSTDEHPQTSERCVICDEPARATSPSRNPHPLPLCGKRKCGDAVVARYDAALERRLQEERASLNAEARARLTAALEGGREEDRGRLRALLSAAGCLTGAPLLELSDDATFGTDTTALAPVTGGNAALAGVSAVPRVAEERRRRRLDFDARCESLAALRERNDPRRAAIEKERAPLDRQHLKYIRLRQAVARAHEPRFVEGSGVREATDITAEEQARIDDAGDKLKPVWERLKVLGEEWKRFEAEERTASDAAVKAREDYHRWLEVECEIRRWTLEAPRRVCERDGVVLLDDTRPFCSDECERRHESFNFVWFPQCERCHRYFVADAKGGTGVIPRLDGTTYCSWLCVATSSEDLDDWPDADALCWEAVRYVPHPPLTAHARAALVRRRLLRQFGERRPAPPFKSRMGPRVTKEAPGDHHQATAGSVAERAEEATVDPGHGTSDRAEPADMKTEIIRVITAEPGLTLKKIRKRVGKNLEAVRTALSQLVAEGRLMREGRGRRGSPERFRLPPEDPAT